MGATPRNSVADNAAPGWFRHRLLIFSICATLATFLIAAIYPSGKPADESTALSFRATYLWIVSQSFWLTLPGLCVGLIVGGKFPRLGSGLGAVLIACAPVLIFCDVLTFSWIGERFLSSTMQKICTTLAPALATQVDLSSVFDAVVVIGVAGFAWITCWLVAGFAARRWAATKQAVSPIAALSILVIVSLGASLPALWHLERTLAEMREHSARHPLCACHVVGYRGVGVDLPSGEQATLARLRGLQSAPDVYRIERKQERVAVDLDRYAPVNPANLPNVAIIVAESMRPELIDPAVMPNLSSFADRSIHCRNHFSAGNSTTLGLFSLVNGLESVWYPRICSQKPIMNRLFRQAGYVTGFFGGANWSHFLMDGYINRIHFDRFQTGEIDALLSDKRAIGEAVEFIGERKRGGPADSDSAPRLAIVYTGGTHSRYLSEPQDQIFQPAAAEDFIIPYSLAMKPQIYNRYKNSARTLDRLIEPLLRDDWLVVFLGDHGESFLEDGSAIHGLRLSKYQNMTPLIIHQPGRPGRIIDGLTMHADVLPTLLSMLEIPVNEPHVFDGLNLLSVNRRQLRERVFTTGNFMDRTAGLIGPWTLDPSRPFAYRFLYRFDKWQLSFLNPIDGRGYELEDAFEASFGTESLQRWIVDRVGPEAVRDDAPPIELFRRFLTSNSRETRLSALRIAADVRNPGDELFSLIAQATRDEDPEIRTLAKEIVIRTHRSEGN